MSTKSPFADFYDLVFKTASVSVQEAYLRELFTKDATLCSSFYNFIPSKLYNSKIIEKINQEIKYKTKTLKQKTKTYKWSTLWQLPSNPESYADDLIKILEEKLVGYNLLIFQSMCSRGELLQALASLRIIELGLNIDWQKVEEPGLYYGPEVGEFIVNQFENLKDYFRDYVFSIAQIKAGLVLIERFKMEPGSFFNNNEEWEQVEDLFREEILGRLL